MFTVLLVDDDADSRLLVTHALKRGTTFEVVAETGDAEEAWSLAASHQPDITLLDVALGVRDGRWALPRIREAAKDTKVVLRSTFPAAELRFLAVTGGAVGYLEKSRSPLTLTDDLLAVCGLLDVIGAGIDEAKARLGAGRHTPGLARRFVSRALERWQVRSELDVIELLVSELVTNSIVHARSDVEVSVAVSSDRIRVAVFDSSREPLVPREAGPEATSGRGLLVLDALATAWGTEFAPGGKSVWFEVRNDFGPVQPTTRTPSL
jgi:DNA-binding NarL/FixJ family response regulator